MRVPIARISTIQVSAIFLLLSLCFSVYAFDEESCKITQEKFCADYSEKIIEGLATSQCWKYEQKSVCTSKEQNHCQIFESNRGCNELSGTCLKSTPLGSCEHFEKKFTCGSKFDENAEVKHAGTDFKILRDEKDLSVCTENEKSKYCEIAEETCVEGAETRDINGKEIHKDCWKWEKKYICRSGSFVDECADLKERCKEISRECIHANEKTKECEHFEVKYQCAENKTKTKDCIATKFCIGDVCQSKQRSQHNDFGSSISYLNILAGMKNNELEGCKCPNGKTTCSSNEIDEKSCKFFTGNSGICRHYTGQFNCCRDKGFVTNIVQCRQDEKDLIQKRSANLCHHTGSWRGKRLAFYKKHQSHCCFKSRLAKIIQIEGRKQLGIGWGDKKEPDCRALSLDELKKIDFTKIDFSELFNDLEHKAKSSIDSKKGQMKDVLAKKINSFYKKGGDQ